MVTKMAECKPILTDKPLNLNVMGPRTVIVPADPIIWDSETSYEYLTLVATSDFGQGYVSKQDVPSGTPLTDTDYWIPVATFSAQVGDMQQRYNQLVEELNKEIADRQSAITSLTNDLNSEIQRAESAENNISKNTSMIENKVNNNKWLIISDSYGQGYTPEGTTQSFIDKIRSWLTPIGYTIYSKAEGGVGFNQEGFNTLVNEAATEIGSDAQNVSSVIFVGSYNDRFQASNDVYSFNQSVSNVINNTRSKFPNAQIWMLPVGNLIQGKDTGAHSTDTYSSVMTARNYWWRTATFNGVNTNYSSISAFFKTAYFASDGVHPNEAGQESIAEMVVSSLLGHTYDNAIFGNYTSTGSIFTVNCSGGIVTNNFNLYCAQTSSEMRIKSSSLFTLNLNTSTINTLTDYVVSDKTLCVELPPTSNYITGTGFGYVVKSSNDPLPPQIPVIVRFSIKDRGPLKMFIMTYPNSNWSYNITNAESINIYSLDMSYSLVSVGM